MTLKQALWEIVRDENIIITNQNIDWLLDRAEKRVNDNTDKNKLKGGILERKEKLDKLGESELPINQTKSNNFDVKSNNEIFKKALVEGVNRRIDKTIEEANKIEQIEEMAKDIAEAINHNSAVDVIRHGLICVNSEGVTRELYDEGYRKQSEGEWIRIGQDSSECSLCGKEHTGGMSIAYFCPNCGARMRGGEK